jgi:GrpB-like predicted nucleotidyltransferase (UPF0157 family)
MKQADIDEGRRSGLNGDERGDMVQNAPVATGPDDYLDDYLDMVLIGGREERTVEIVDYDADWPVRYLEERGRIAHALGSQARRIEHIGSTAVPGLSAKPIVDIMVSVDDPDDEAAIRQPLETVGYVLRVREPHHRMYRTPERDVHVHIWEAGGDDEERHLRFRDRLRSNAEARDRYERTKRALAGRYRDMNYYAEAKSAVIEEILEGVDGEATST